VISFLTASLSPFSSMRVLSLEGANLSSLVALSRFSYLIVLAMCASVHGALVFSLILLSNYSCVYTLGLYIHFLSVNSILDLTPTALSLNILIYSWVNFLFRTLKFYTKEAILATNKLLLTKSLLEMI
jgi:hypothetical protein